MKCLKIVVCAVGLLSCFGGARAADDTMITQEMFNGRMSFAMLGIMQRKGYELLGEEMPDDVQTVDHYLNALLAAFRDMPDWAVLCAQHLRGDQVWIDFDGDDHHRIRRAQIGSAFNSLYVPHVASLCGLLVWEHDGETWGSLLCSGPPEDEVRRARVERRVRAALCALVANNWGPNGTASDDTLLADARDYLAHISADVA